MDELLHATRELYDREAWNYDKTTGDFAFFPGLRSEVDRFYDRALKTRPILDLGCGVGRDTKYLLTRGCVVVAADLSMKMLEVTKQRCGPAAAPNLVQLSMLELPFANHSFGGAWICASLLHIPSSRLASALMEIFRTLAPGGTVAVSMKAGDGEGWQSGQSLATPRWFTLIQPTDFEDLLRSVGFVAVASTPSGRGDWFVTEADRN